MAKTQSLAAQTGTLMTPFTMPAVFQAPMEPIQAWSNTPYITFAHSKRADEWTKLTAKFGQVSEGDMYLVAPNLLHKLDLAKLGWLCHRQLWAESDPAGNLLRASFKEQPKPYKERIEAVVLVYLEDRIIPANVEFRSTKCPAAKTLSDGAIEACGPDWGNKSAAHAETLVCNQPWMRFYGEVQMGDKRTSKSTGLPYRPTICTIKPTSVTEWRLLKAFCDDPGSQKALQDTANVFERRVAEFKAKS